MRDVARQRGKPRRVFAGGDDFGVFFRVDAETAQGETQRHVRSRAQAIDAAGLALELFHAGDVTDRDDVIDELRQVRRDHNRIGAGKTRGYQGCRRRDDEIDFSCEQRLNHDGACADGDHFGVQAIFFEETFLIGDPDGRVRGRAARPGDAHALLGKARVGE